MRLSDLMRSILEMHRSCENWFLCRLQTTMIYEIRILIMLRNRVRSSIVIHRRRIVAVVDNHGDRGGL